MLKKLSVLTIFLVNLALMGCGTKGPLYIPEQRYPQSGENNIKQKSVKSDATGLNHSSAGLQANIHAPDRASI